MSVSEKASPLKSAQHSATQSISTAEDLIQGIIEPNTIDDTDVPTIIRALQALRHKSMISDQIERQKKCESIISELTLQKQSRSSSSLSNLKKSRRSSSRQGSIRGDSLSNYSSFQQDDYSAVNFELTDEELEQMNYVIDSLLNGDEIESIEPEAIPQLNYALKERRKLYLNDGNYLLVKKIEEQIYNLEKISQDNKKFATSNSIKNIEKNNNRINEFQNKVNDIEKKIEKLKITLDEELNKIEESKDAAKTKIFKEIEDDAKLIEEETNEVDLGFSFKPSSDLLEMRSLETKYAKVSRYEAAAELRKMADELETQERKAYDQNARAAINKKERNKKLIHKQKSQKCEEYYQNIREKTIKKFNKWIEGLNKEADAAREKISKLQEQYSTINDDTNNIPDDNNSIDENQFENDLIADSNNIYNDFNDEAYLNQINNENLSNDEILSNNENQTNENEAISNGSFTEQEFKEHERNIYTPFNSKLPDSSTSPYVGLTEMNELDQKGQTSPVNAKNQENSPTQNNDDQENGEVESEIKIDANQSVNADQESENEKVQNDANSENNQPKVQSKNKRTKKVVRKVVKKAPKKSA